MRKAMLIFSMVLPIVLFAQGRQQRFELILMGGGASYSGDVGGNQTKFTSDYIKIMGPSLGLGARVHVTNFLAVRAGFNYSMLQGADSFSNTRDRINRNLSFRTPVYEGNLLFELSLFNWKHLSGQNVKSTRSGRANLYLFLGMGFFKFNPQAYYQNTWHDLQPLGTEGQGVKPGLGKYELSSSSLIMGLGYRYLIGGRFSLGLEAGFRKTNTDYLDDVSKEYYDNGAIAQTNGNIAAALADRNLSDRPYPSGTKRGNPGVKDYYGTVQVTLAFKLGSGGYSQYRGGGKNFRTRSRCFQF